MNDRRQAHQACPDNKRNALPTSPLHPASRPLAHGTIQRSLHAPHSLSPSETLQLQSTMGNQHVQTLLQAGSRQAVIQRAPGLVPDTVGALNRPNWAKQHERRYQELVGDLQQDPNANEKSGPLLSFEEYQKFDKEYQDEIGKRGGARGYVEQFAPGQLPGTPKTSEDRKVFSFDPQKALTHWDKLLDRIKPIASLNTGEFKSLMAYYITSLASNDKKKAGYALLKVIDYLDTVSGFQVSRADTKVNQQKVSDTIDPNISALQKETAKISREHGQLWSKLNKYIAYETAKAEGGISLENTLGAKLFDELDFGTTGEVLGPQWTSLSAHFVRGLRGTVHAHAFRGTVTASVFSSTEWPRIRIMLEAGELEKLVIHVYDFPKDEKNLKEDKSKQVIVTKENYNKDVIKMLDQEAPASMEDFWKKQTLAHDSEGERYKNVKDLRRQNKQGKKSFTS